MIELIARLVKFVEINEQKREHDDILSIFYIPYSKEWWVKNEHYEDDLKNGRIRIEGKGKSLQEALMKALQEASIEVHNDRINR